MNKNVASHLSKRRCNGFERFIATQLLEYSLHDRILLKEFSMSFCSRHTLTKDALIDSLRLLASEHYIKINWRAHEPNIVLDRNRCEEMVRK